MNYHTYSSQETKIIGARLAAGILKTKPAPRARVIALRGDLGAGKTTFTQGFLKACGVRGSVSSPTFVLIKRYKLSKKLYTAVYHIDCYRVHTTKEFLVLGLKDILNNPDNIVLIEWPEKVRRFLPKQSLFVALSHVKESERKIVFSIKTKK